MGVEKTLEEGEREDALFKASIVAVCQQDQLDWGYPQRLHGVLRSAVLSGDALARRWAEAGAEARDARMAQGCLS